MSDISSELAFRITQQGAEDVRAGLMGIDRAAKQTSLSTQTLTGFVKEQRRENLQANFIFKESRQAINAVGFAALSLASATGGASKEMQKINQTLVSGFSAFQASGFAMAALGVGTGGVATAISAVLGLGAGLLTFLQDTTDEAGKAAEGMDKIKSVLQRVAEIVDKQTKDEIDLQKLRDRRDTLRDALAKEPTKTSPIFVRMRREVSILNEEIDALVERLGLLVGTKAGMFKIAKERSDWNIFNAEGAGKLGPRQNNGKPEQIPFKRETIRDLGRVVKLTDSVRLDMSDIWNSSEMIAGNFFMIEGSAARLGIETDSWIGKLNSALEIVLAIKAAVDAIKILGSIFGFLGGGGGAVAAGAVAPPLPGGSMGGGVGPVQLQKALRSPAVRNEMAMMISDMSRRGKI